MPTGTTDRPLSTTGLVWCLHSYLWLLLLSVFGAAAGALILLAQPGSHEAKALVVTRQLDPNPKILPRYASSIFYGGEVARLTAAELGGDPSGLVPARLDIIAPEDSIIMTVVGKDVDPATAAQLADAGAEALVTELNRAGPGVGTFSVQAKAAVPNQPTVQLPPALAAALGGLAGAVLALSTVVLIAVVRRPVVAAEDVQAAVDSRLLGVLTLKLRQWEFAHPRDVPGMVAVARQIAADPAGRFLVISESRDSVARQQVVVALGVALGGRGATRLYGEPYLRKEMRALGVEPAHRPAGGVALAPTARRQIVLVDQVESLDLLHEAERPLRVVIVTRKGVPATRLRSAAAEHLPSEVLGVVLVERRRLGRRAKAAAAPRTDGRGRGTRVRSSHAVDWLARCVVLCLVAGSAWWPAAGFAQPPPSLDDVPESFVGPEFGMNRTMSPTRYDTQNKLWFHDDAWWALMLEPSGTVLRIFELRPDHTWRPTAAVISTAPLDTGDALSQGDVLFLVSRRTDSVIQFNQLGYDPNTREYIASRAPVIVTDRGSSAPPSIVRDSTGQLWVTFATNSEVFTTSSVDGGAVWSPPSSISAPFGRLSTREGAAVVAFDDSIGVLWSDQATDVVRLGVHRDGTPPDEWGFETVLEGVGPIGNQLSLKALDHEPSDVLVGAITVIPAEGAPPDSPSILVVARASDGTWSSRPGARLVDALKSPYVQVDATNDLVYLFAHGAASVSYKQAPLATLDFPAGRGRPFVTSEGLRVVDPAGSAHPVDARTGFVVVASGADDGRYHHAEVRVAGVPPPGPEPDAEAPSAPTELVATADNGVVSLYWSPSGDGDQWAPASERSPVRGYLVLRGGVEIGTTAETSYSDEPPSGVSHEYAVRAVDFADNASDPSTASVLVTAPGRSPVQLAAWLLLAAGGIGAVALLAARWRASRP